MWLAATILPRTDLERAHHPRKFYWTALIIPAGRVWWWFQGTHKDLTLRAVRERVRARQTWVQIQRTNLTPGQPIKLLRVTASSMTHGNILILSSLGFKQRKLWAIKSDLGSNSGPLWVHQVPYGFIRLLQAEFSHLYKMGTMNYIKKNGGGGRTWDESVYRPCRVLPFMPPRQICKL